jgi:hypothetical protein
VAKKKIGPKSQQASAAAAAQQQQDQAPLPSLYNHDAYRLLHPPPPAK